MTCTYRVGVASSPASAKAMAEYLNTETLRPENAELARYYAGELAPEPLELTPEEQLGRDLNEGAISFGEAINLLMDAEIAANRGLDFDYDAAEDSLATKLMDAAERADFEADSSKVLAEGRPDLSPAFAARLGLDRLPLTVNTLAHLLNGRRLDDGEIEGRVQRSATLSIADVFGIDPKLAAPLNGDAVQNILSARRVDGEAPRDAKGNALAEDRIAGARRRFLNDLGVPSHREPTDVEAQNLLAGKRAGGGNINLGEYRRHITATRGRVSYIDLTFSPDKSLSVAWALAPTEGERAILAQVHKDAVADTMHYVEHVLGVARRGAAGKGGNERGELAWLSFQHYTSRPTEALDRTEYTELREVPLKVADPQLHTHVLLLNSILTKSGHLGSIDLDKLDGALKQFGAVYQAYVATHARAHGIDVALDDRTRAARLAAVPSSVRDFFSKRAAESQKAAERFAKEKGIDWDTLSPAQQSALLRAGAAEMRQAKDKRELADGAVSDFAEWRNEVREALGYQHRSVLRSNVRQPELTDEQRQAMAYDVSQKFLAEDFGRRAKLEGEELREIAARGFIEAGMKDPVRDIAAVTRRYREEGVRQDGQMTPLLWGEEAPVRGKQRLSVTTDLHLSQEQRLVSLAKEAHGDRSAALSQREIDRAVAAFLDRTPAIDPHGAHWQKQRAMIDALGGQGRLAVAVGAGGSGKSTVLRPLVDAWRQDGREVWGVSLAWKISGRLSKTAGLDRDKETLALDPFLKRVERGKIKLDRNSVVVVDEVAMIGKRQFLELLEKQQTMGFMIVAAGDDRQTTAIEAGPVVGLLRKALDIPEIGESIRQKTERERTITSLFREGRAAEALEMKRADGAAELVAGGARETVRRVADLWEQRTAANGGDIEAVTISAPKNEDVRKIGLAIREKLQLADGVVIKATDKNSGERYDLALAPGDRVRLFDRVHDADRGGRDRVLGDNGDVATVLALNDRGMRIRGERGEGTVAWTKIRGGKGEPVRLNYGYATTIETAQGSTAKEHIIALPDGSPGVNLFKGYTAASRHEHAAWLVIDEASERRDITRRIPLGEDRTIRQQQIWANIAKNLSRAPEKATALSLLEKATNLRRGSLRGLQVAGEREERSQPLQRDLGRAQRMSQLIRELPAIVAQQARELGRGLRL